MSFSKKETQELTKLLDKHGAHNVLIEVAMILDDQADEFEEHPPKRLPGKEVSEIATTIRSASDKIAACGGRLGVIFEVWPDM